MKRLIILVMALLVLTLVGCGGGGKQEQQASTDKPKMQQEELLTPAGGLGDTLENINKACGKPTEIREAINSEGFGRYYFYKDITIGTYIDERAREITIKPSSGKKWSQIQALEEIKKHIPKDSVLVKSWDKDETRKIYYYKSDILSKYFKDNWYEDIDGNVNRGSFIVVVHNMQGISSIMIATGSNI